MFACVVGINVKNMYMKYALQEKEKETQTERISSSSTFNYIVNCANLPDDDMQIMNLSATYLYKACIRMEY